MKKGKKLLFPNKDNDYQPHFLKDSWIKSLLGIALVIEFIIILLISPILDSKLDFLAAVIPSVLVSKTNDERVDIGKNTLVTNDRLVLAAQMKANDMAEGGYFSHVSPDGKTPWYWLEQSKYEYVNAGENLAVNFVDSSDVHKAWMNSPTHKANIVRDEFTEIGIATAEGKYKGRNAIFVVQFFGQPKIVTVLEEKVSIEPESVVSVEEVEVESSGDVLGSESETLLENDTPVEEMATTFDNSTVELNNDVIEVPWYKKILASPITYLNIILIGMLIILSSEAILNIFMKIKVQHANVILNSILLILVIITFIYINSQLVIISSDII